jgi:hypothetical protein
MYITRRLIAVVLVAITALATFGCSMDKMNEWVPAGMKKISTDAVDYNLYIPSAWEEDISTGVVTAYVSSSDRTSISMTAFDLDDPNQTVQQYWDKNKEVFTSFFTDMQFETEGESTLLGGVAAGKYVYTANASSVPYKFMQIICIKEGTVYIFTYTATADKYDTHLQSVEEILTNFSFIS